MPSVRGRAQLTVASCLVGAGTASGGLAGLAGAVVLAPLRPVPSPLAVVLVAVVIGASLDRLQLLVGRPHPLTSGRQVPREWGRLFGPHTVALLYGARLGVGPLTILSTWTWWSVTLASALIGPITAVTVGAVFGFVRLLVTAAVSAVVSVGRAGRRRDHAAWFRWVRARQRSNWRVLNGIGVAMAVAVFAAGCGAGPGADDRGLDVTTASSSTIPSTTPPTSPSTSPSTSPQPRATTPAPPAPTGNESIIPVRLEDVVRTATTEATERPRAKTWSSEPEALAAALTASIDGYEPIGEPGADRHLDLQAAAELQPDPTEEVALLETRGFEGGWTRAFRNEHNDVAVVSVYQFDDPAEAEFYLEDGLITIGGYGGKFFDIADLPGVRGFVQYFSETDEGGTEDLVSLGAAFQTGPRWYLVYFVGSTDTVTPEVLVPTVAAQRQAAGDY